MTNEWIRKVINVARFRLLVWSNLIKYFEASGESGLLFTSFITVFDSCKIKSVKVLSKPLSNRHFEKN